MPDVIKKHDHAFISKREKCTKKCPRVGTENNIRPEKLRDKHRLIGF